MSYSPIHEQKLEYIREKLAKEHDNGHDEAEAELLHLLDWGTSGLQDIYKKMGRTEHPIYTKELWTHAVNIGSTESGYWPWVVQSVGEKHRFKTIGGRIEIQHIPSF